MKTILLIEDSTEIHILLKKVCDHLAANLVIASSIQEARLALLQLKPNFILFDICLPDGDGIQFCSEMLQNEKTRHIPFMFLSTKEAVSTKIAAFSLGAEDYIAKPFSIMELTARLEARLKKIEANTIKNQPLIRGKLYIDVSRHRVWIMENHVEFIIPLTEREFNILFYLAENENHVIGKNKLLDAVWGPNSYAFDRTIDSHISSIQKKLGKLSNYIQFVQDAGYCFVSSTVNEKETA